MMPPGFKFDPTDEELLTFYLPCKVNGARLPYDPCIDCDIYNNKSNNDGREEACAWKEVFNQNGETTHYFFTKLKRKNEKGKRIERTSGTGTWKTQQERVIKSGRGKIIGFKRFLSFVPQKKSSFPTSMKDEFQWIMHEYRLPEQESFHSLQDYVLCRIKKKGKPKEKSTFTTDCPSSYGDDDRRNDPVEDEGTTDIRTPEQESDMSYLSTSPEDAHNFPLDLAAVEAYKLNNSDEALFTPDYDIPIEPISTITATFPSTNTSTPVTATNTDNGTSSPLSTEDLLGSISWEYDSDQDFGITWRH